MIRPGVGELLDGVADRLAETVVEELRPGTTARNQVRAAIAVLRRVAAVWDRVVPTVAEDNRDIEHTLGEVAALLETDARTQTLATALAAALAAVPPATGERSGFRAAAARNEALQSALDALQSGLDDGPTPRSAALARSALAGLARRMVARDRRLAGRDLAL